MPETTSRYERETFSAFQILPWSIDPATRTLSLRYALDDVHVFEERIVLASSLPFDGVSGTTRADVSELVCGVVDLLAVVAGVSYFKVSAPRRIEVGFGLTSAALSMANLTYDDGMREFAFRAGLQVPLTTAICADAAPAVPAAVATSATDTRRPLMPMGGGRDSALLASMLAPFEPILTAHGENRFVARVATVLGSPLHRVQRILDPRLFELNAGPAMNGHIPVTAVNSLIGVVTAALAGATDVIMANERSASAASMTTDSGEAVNHQYSKSFGFEIALADAIDSVGGPTYFSGLRPWNELAIARAFAARTELHPAIMSCNRAFLRDPAMRSDGWCGHCDKCRFVWLTLSPFMERADLVAMFGRDLWDIPSNIEGFAALLRTDRRPWDCVGEPSEALLALRLIAPDEPIAAALLATTATNSLTATNSSTSTNPNSEPDGSPARELDESVRPSAEERIPEPYRQTLFESMSSTVHS